MHGKSKGSSKVRQTTGVEMRAAVLFSDDKAALTFASGAFLPF